MVSIVDFLSPGQKHETHILLCAVSYNVLTGVLRFFLCLSFNHLPLSFVMMESEPFFS